MSVVGDINRHLQIHVRKGELSEEAVTQMAEVMGHGKRKHVMKSSNTKAATPKRRKKWCPVEGCGRVVARVDKHLQSVDKINSTSVAYKVHLKAAKPYLGIQEMETMIRKADTESESEADTPCKSGKTESGEWESAQSNDSAQMQESNGKAGDSNLEEAQTPEPESPADEAKGSKSSSSSSSPFPSPGSESSEEESKVSGSLSTKEYFLATTYFNNRHRWLCEFVRYLALPDAGYKKMAARLQHAAQVSRILEEIDPDGDDIICLCADRGDVVWKSWVEPQLKRASRPPGTILSYLTSIEQFYRFISSKKYDPRKIPPLHPSYREIFEALVSSMKGWRACVDSSTQDTQMWKYMTEIDTLISPQAVSQIKETRPYIICEKAVKEAASGKTLSREEFVAARDLSQVHVSNRHSSCTTE